jgi:nucleotide-binding universal stress UspA family protein
MPGILVGVDGSAASQEALEWAVKHAALEHAPLTVLAVHEVAASAWTGNPILLPEDRPEEEHARQAAQEIVNKLISDLGGAAPESVTVRGVSGAPAQILIEASADADLVVVGSRGAGGFANLLTGSVSSKVVNHAACPVVVVRHHK